LTVQGDWPDDVNDLALMPRSNGLEGATPALIVEINDFSWLITNLNWPTAPHESRRNCRSCCHTIELANRVSIEVRPCNFKTLRGPTYIAIMADEVAFWFKFYRLGRRRDEH
jgi:hypothetical protein